MTDIIRIGLDTSKNLFQLHGVDATEQPVLRKQLRRGEMIKFFERLPPVLVALEACGASHHWARLLSSSVHMRAHQQAAHMPANDLIKLSGYTSCKREPSTYATNS